MIQSERRQPCSCGATHSMKTSRESPLGRGKRRQALGWVVAGKRYPPRRSATAVASAPPLICQAESELFVEDPQISRDGKQLLYSRGRITGDIWILRRGR